MELKSRHARRTFNSTPHEGPGDGQMRFGWGPNDLVKGPVCSRERTANGIPSA